MAVKLFPNNILLLEVYSFKGFSNQYKNDGMANNYCMAQNFAGENIDEFDDFPVIYKYFPYQNFLFR